jgi:hypothetical protein
MRGNAIQNLRQLNNECQPWFRRHHLLLKSAHGIVHSGNSRDNEVNTRFIFGFLENEGWREFTQPFLAHLNRNMEQTMMIPRDDVLKHIHLRRLNSLSLCSVRGMAKSLAAIAYVLG